MMVKRREVMRPFAYRYFWGARRLACTIVERRNGQEFIEYALIAGFVAIAAAAVLPTNIQAVLNTVFTKLNVLI